MAWKHFSEEQWNKIREYLPRRKRARGRPPADDRQCLEGILWILWTGAQWSQLPKEYGCPSTVWRRLKRWSEDGTLLELWRAFLGELNDKEKIAWDECFIDGSFAPAKKGAQKSAILEREKEQSGWYWQMATVLRWEHTWTRRPRRKSHSSKRRSTPSQ